jgi:hypothetical protein
MTRLAWLEQRYAQFEQAAKSYNNMMDETLKFYSANNPGGAFRGPLLSRNIPEQTISQMAREDLGSPLHIKKVPV